MAKITLKIASYLYFSYAGLIVVFTADSYLIGHRGNETNIENSMILALFAALIFFGAIIYNQAKHMNHSIYTVLYCVLCTGIYGYVESYTFTFWLAATPCVLVVIAYIAFKNEQAV